jgi:hypothetical protein
MRRTVERLSRETLLNLLQMYETALRELQATDDQSVIGLIRRFQRRRSEVIAALSTQRAA